MKIGYIGLGKMGLNMTYRLLEKGHEVVATDVNDGARNEAEVAGAVVMQSNAEVVRSLSGKRTIWLMVPWKVVDFVLDEILPELSEGDVVIDGGNSPYLETLRRKDVLEEKGVEFIDVGVSGGPAGARNGACMMIGGKESVYNMYTELFKDLCVEGGFGKMGPTGSGHYVKMVHNGIEYGMMQAIGEGFGLLKQASEFDGLNLSEIARVYNHGSVIESRLIGWLQNAYKEEGEDLEAISGEVNHSGEGLWTVEAAKREGTDIRVIEDALQFREDSQGNPSYIGKVVSALRNQFGGHDVSKGE